MLFSTKTEVQQRAQRVAVAYHEAGHAVASLLTGETFEYVTIIPTDESLGHVAIKEVRRAYYRNERNRQRAERWVIIDFAGPIAEAVFLRKRWCGFRFESATEDELRRFVQRTLRGQDRKESQRAANYFCSYRGTSELQARFCFLRAWELVKEHWREIKNVADALRERETLSYEEVQAICRPARRRARR